LATGRIERRLAAILATDVVGYSRLMEADEEGTQEHLKILLRQLVNPKIKEHRGRIVKNTGDGMLVEFGSVVDAVRCAVDMQCRMIDRNVELSEDKRISFRIGVNLGDVIVESEDIFGDGVNIAARLEALAEPGGICASRVVYEEVAGKLDVTFEDMGEQSIKNIARPVRVYRIVLGERVGLSEPAKGHQGNRSSGCQTSLRLRCCRSRTCRATPNRNTSPTVWSRRSSPRSAASAGSS